MIIARVLERGGIEEPRGASPARDPIYLFACHLEWHNRGNLRAYSELMAALCDRDEEIRLVAETLLTRGSSQAMLVGPGK